MTVQPLAAAVTPAAPDAWIPAPATAADDTGAPADKPKGKRRKKTGEDVVADMLPRMIRSLRQTWTDNPELMAHYDALLRILQESRQVAVANTLEARRQDVSDVHAWSARDLGEALGMTRQSAMELGAKGRKVLAEEAEYTNVSRFTAAYRERIKSAGVRAKVEDLRARFGQRTGTDG
jgi:CHASE3 domain sensor protein